MDKNTTVKMILEFLRSESKYFNYSAIRINGMKSKNVNSNYNLNLFFEPNKDQYFELVSAIQICFFSKTSLNLRNYKIVFPDEYNTDYLG